MSAPSILFRGGPCDGLRLNAADDGTAPEHFTCLGVIYNVVPESEGQYLAVPPDAPQPTPHPGGSPAPDAVPLDGGMHAAWEEFRRTVGRKVPDAINATTRARARIRRAGMR